MFTLTLFLKFVLHAETVSYSHLERNGITSKEKEAHAPKHLATKTPKASEDIKHVGRPDSWQLQCGLLYSYHFIKS